MFRHQLIHAVGAQAAKKTQYLALLRATTRHLYIHLRQGSQKLSHPPCVSIKESCCTSITEGTLRSCACNSARRNSEWLSTRSA